MQPIDPSLPELHPVGDQPVSAPVLRSWDFMPFILNPELLHGLLQPLAAFEHLALRRSQRTQSALPGATLPVLLGFGSRDSLHSSFDSYLPVKRLPVEKQGRPG